MSERPLGKAQLAMLGEICRTNGGGVSGYRPNQRTMRSLEERGLIQGKAGQEWCAVHTREGLELWRSLQARGKL